jgi:hypothetical protein
MESSVSVDASLTLDITDQVIRIFLRGELTAERLTAAMNAVARDERYRHGMHAIADLRECSGQWDFSEIQRFRDYVVRIGGSRPCRWAAVVRPGALESVARILILISEAVGASIAMRLFDDMHGAQRWIEGEAD